MNNMKSRFSLSFVMLLIVVMSLGNVFAVERLFTISASYNGTTLKEGEVVTVEKGKELVYNITVNPQYVHSSLTLGYQVDSQNVVTFATGTKTAVARIPNNFEAGSGHVIKFEAFIMDHEHNYVCNSNILTTYVRVPSDTKLDVELKDNNTTVDVNTKITKAIGSELTIIGTPSSLVNKIAYKWDSEDMVLVNSNPATIIIPNRQEGVHSLQVQAQGSDGTFSKTKLYKIKIVKELDDELVVEPWMEENDDIEELSVSLRNDSQEYEKGNKNFYALDEEVVYYVDYKNGGDDIEREIKLVLKLPLDFKVIDSFGGVVDNEERTITWTFANGLEEGACGTKVVKVAYESLGRASRKYEIVYPVANIYNRSKIVDSSAVINFIYKDSDTEITAEHYPYMFGDEDRDTFRPNDTITRAEGALVLTRIFGIDTSNTQIRDVFPDLNETYPEAQRAIIAATDEGLIKGFPDGTYRPNAKMTKGQFMSILALMVQEKAEDEDIDGLEVKELENTIKIYADPKNYYMVDGKRVSIHWAIEEVSLLARLNMTPLSEDDDEIKLDENITRAEVAQLINFYLLRAPAQVTSKTKSNFSDVKKKHDLFADILEATRDEHTYTITPEGYEEEYDD